jgi:hypothetical protein
MNASWPPAGVAAKALADPRGCVRSLRRVCPSDRGEWRADQFSFVTSLAVTSSGLRASLIDFAAPSAATFSAAK